MDSNENILKDVTGLLTFILMLMVWSGIDFLKSKLKMIKRRSNKI